MGRSGAACCKWHRLADQYYVSANFFHSEKEAFRLHPLVRSADFTLGKKKAFICPVAEPECYRLVQEKKRPQVMVHYLNGTFPPLFLDNGQLIHPRDLTLGGCVAQQTSNYILGFQAELHGCNSMLQVCFFFFFSFFFAFCFVEHLNSLLFCLLLQMTEDTLIYSFSLVYSPTPIGNTVIVKTNPAKVLIECHYQRYAQLPPHSPKKHKKKVSFGFCLPPLLMHGRRFSPKHICGASEVSL